RGAPGTGLNRQCREAPGKAPVSAGPCGVASCGPASCGPAPFKPGSVSAVPELIARSCSPKVRLNTWRLPGPATKKKYGVCGGSSTASSADSLGFAIGPGGNPGCL